MKKKSKSKEKDKSLLQRSYRLTEQSQSQVKSSRTPNNQRLYQLEQKLREFGGLEQRQEQLLKDLTENNQRLDSIITAVRCLVKHDPKSKRSNVSPIGKAGASSKISEKEKTSRRLIERVEKAISHQHGFQNSTK